MLRQTGAVRDLHRRTVVAALDALGPASRSDLAQATGLSRATVSRILSELRQLGAVSEAGNRAPGGRPGRPTTLLVLAPPSGFALAVDLGHDHARVLVANAAGVIDSERVEWYESRSPADTGVRIAASLIRDSVAGSKLGRDAFVGVVVGVPSPVDLQGQPTARRYQHLDLVSTLGLDAFSRRVVIRNDAHLAAAGEAAFGSARQWQNFIYLKIARGLGAGLVLGRKLYRGRGFAGDIGHVPVRPDGDVCICGNRGCLETLVSADSLVRALQPAHPDTALDIPGVVSLSAAGDLGARRLVTDAGRTIGRTLADVLALLNPDAIVVGGELAQLGEPLLHGIEESIARHTSPPAAQTVTITESECGPRAAALGGVALALGLVAEHTDGLGSEADHRPAVGSAAASRG